MSKSPVSICHDKRTMTTTGDNAGKFPVKIKVNFKVREGKTTKYVVRRYHVTPDEVFAKTVREYNQKKKDASVILAQAKAIELYKKGLSVEDFERLYTSSGTLDEIKTIYEVLIKKMEEDGRDGNGIALKNSLSSLIAYKGEFITFGTVTKEFLTGWEKWLLTPREVVKGSGKHRKKKLITHTINTVGMYTRSLKSVVNYAIDPLKIIPADSSPFGRRKYVPPSGPRQTKKALSREERNIVLSHRSGRDDVNFALDIWSFQYLGNGCNMADVAYMKRRHIVNTLWKFDRKKTENTERNKSPIDVELSGRMLQVIARYGNKSLDPDSYVFPILRPDMTSRQRKYKIMDFIGDTNELLAVAQGEINTDREKIGLPKLSVKLTSGTARYTAVTILRKHGIDLSIIAKTLGHGSAATTELYAEEEREARKMISQALSL